MVRVGTRVQAIMLWYDRVIRSAYRGRKTEPKKQTQSSGSTMFHRNPTLGVFLLLPSRDPHQLVGVGNRGPACTLCEPTGKQAGIVTYQKLLNGYM